MVALPLETPHFTSPDRAGEWNFRYDVAALARQSAEWARAKQIKPAGSDVIRVCLLIIDGQKDFTNKEGTLYVAGRSGTGAIDDCSRTARFIYRNARVITDIKCTLDSHSTHQIFYATFWQGPNGELLSPHTLIVPGPGGRMDNVGLDGALIHAGVTPRIEMLYVVFGYDVQAQKVKGSYNWLVQYCRHYVEKLAKSNKKALYLWPPHTLVGEDGHALNGALREGVHFHSFARGTHNFSEIKGGLFIAENYSVFAPEVMEDHTGRAFAQRNTALLETIISYDAVIIVGQAKSHCVYSSADDALGWLVLKDPNLAKRIYLVEDCMSSVVVGPHGGPGDFTDIGDAGIDKFRSAGANVVKSTDPIETWPGIPAGLVA